MFGLSRNPHHNSPICRVHYSYFDTQRRQHSIIALFVLAAHLYIFGKRRTEQNSPPTLRKSLPRTLIMVLRYGVCIYY